MHKKEFISILTDPDKLKETDYTHFSEIIKKYPLFSIARIFQLIAAENKSPAVFNELLKKNAAYLNNLSYLHRLIKTKLIFENGLSGMIPQPNNVSLNETDSLPDPNAVLSASPSEELLSFEYKKPERKLSGDEDPGYQKEPLAEKPGSPSADFNRKLSIIDQFINNNPGSIRQDENILPEREIVIPDILDEDSLITDTLAKIYIKQRLYTKAIYAYEKLILKYPEKSVYFAAQIDLIKKLINK
jgi:hypothetical protein